MKNKGMRKTLMLLVILGSVVVCVYGAIQIALSENRDKNISMTKKRITLITKSTDSAFWQLVYSGASAASTEYNLDLIFQGPDNEEDYETQNQMIRKAVEEGTDAIVFSAIDYNENAEAINAAVQAGVKVIVIDSDVNSSKVSCRIGTENYEAGCMAGKVVLECKESVLNIGIVNFDEVTENGQKREQGFRETVEQDERAVIRKSINVQSSIVSAKEGTKRMLEEDPEINVIVTFNEWTSLGVGYAIRDLKASEKTTVVAFDSNVVSVDMLESGEVDALIVQNPYAMGYLGVENAYSLLKGSVLQSEKIDTMTKLVTRENMYSDECQRILFAFDKEY